jgi:hypothetical protein
MDEDAATRRARWQRLAVPEKGMAGPGAVVLITGELIEAVEQQTEAARRLEQRMWWLGLIGVILAAIGAVLTAVQIWV